MFPDPMYAITLTHVKCIIHLQSKIAKQIYALQIQSSPQRDIDRSGISL